MPAGRPVGSGTGVIPTSEAKSLIERKILASIVDSPTVVLFSKVRENVLAVYPRSDNQIDSRLGVLERHGYLKVYRSPKALEITEEGRKHLEDLSKWLPDEYVGSIASKPDLPSLRGEGYVPPEMDDTVRPGARDNLKIPSIINGVPHWHGERHYREVAAAKLSEVGNQELSLTPESELDYDSSD